MASRGSATSMSFLGTGVLPVDGERGEFSAGVNGNILRPPSDTNHTLEPTVSLDSVSYRPATLIP